MAAILATDATDAATDACSAAVGGKKPGAAMRGDDTLTNGTMIDFHRQLTVPLCLGVRDPGIAELRSVVSRVAS